MTEPEPTKAIMDRLRRGEDVPLALVGPRTVPPPVDPPARDARATGLLPPRIDLRACAALDDAHATFLRHVRTWLTTPAGCVSAGRWLTLLGRPGTGKTEAARAIGAAVLDAGFGVRYWKFDDLLAALRKARGDADWMLASAMPRFMAPGLVIVDEVYPVFKSLDDENLTHRFLCERYEGSRDGLRRALVLCSNLTFEALRDVTGAAAADRLRDSTLVACTWPSFRGRP